MQKYLFYGSYTPQGYKGLLAEGGSRRIEAVSEALSSVGGALEAFYFCFGEYDFFVIVNLPDNVDATAFSLTSNASGSFTIKTIPLLAPEEIDRAAKKSIKYRLPGK